MDNQARCINVDWLELYCYEPAEGRPAEYYRRAGYYVEEREYGTPHMQEVFTVYDADHNPFVEIRRAPRSKTGHHTIYPDNACNIKLHNYYCYHDRPCALLDDFCVRHGYEVRRIFRIDIALDFVRFDSGDWPDKFLRRVVSGQLRKIYQANRRIQGKDRWEGCQDNYISYGNPESMVLTRFYDKTLEVRESGLKKMWIPQAWFKCGLIDDPVMLTKTQPDGTITEPRIWRLEFQISSKARRWYRTDGEGEHEWVEHTLDTYDGRDRLLLAFDYLQRHYFHFVHYQKNKSKYKCPEKILFKFHDFKEVYSLSQVLATRQYSNTYNSMINEVRRIQYKLQDPLLDPLFNVIIARIERSIMLDAGGHRAMNELATFLATLENATDKAYTIRQALLDFAQEA